MNWMYCRVPPISATITDEYSARSSPGTLAFQITSPVFLLRATMAASLPPGVAISFSPSMSGDSEYCQPPTWPLNSLCRFFCHLISPLFTSRQTRSPWKPRVQRKSPSTVGVLRGPSVPPPPLQAEILVAHSSLPLASSSAQTNSSLPRSLMPKMRPPATEGVLYPPPRLLISQASGGPPLGQSFRRPVSLLISSRCGPRHCGQS